MACPFSSSDVSRLTVSYCTVPSNVHPGTSLSWLNTINEEVEFPGKFAGGDSKSGF